MKILWFANTPCGAAKKFDLKLNIGGWLTSMENELVQVKGVQLFVSFYWGEQIEPFVYGKSTYYPVLRKGDGSRSGRLVRRALNLNNNDKEEVKRLVDVIKTIKPDIIHVHGTESNFGLIQPFTDIPVIISIQGILSAYFEKYYAGIPAFSAFKNEGLMPKLLFKSARYAYHNLLKAAVKERKILSEARYIVGRTDWDRRISRLLAPKSRYFIGNEILRAAFYDNKWNKGRFNGPIRLVTMMSSGLYKGFETIVNTAILLRKQNIIDFTWTVIGQSEHDDMIKIVKSWLNVNFKELNIDLVGLKAEKEVADILLQSDIFCQVSHIENSPNGLCEAMLLGMPIIASFAGGTDSLLENRKQGVLVQDGDAYSLAGAIMEISGDFPTALLYGNEANQVAKSRHNRTTIALELIDTYRDILELER